MFKSANFRPIFVDLYNDEIIKVHNKNEHLPVFLFSVCKQLL